MVCVRGRLDLREDDPKLICMDLKRPELATDESEPLHLVLPLHALSDDRVLRLKQLLADHQGQAPVFLHVGSKIIRLAAEFNVNARAGLLAELRVLLGAGCLLTSAPTDAFGKRDPKPRKLTGTPKRRRRPVRRWRSTSGPRTAPL